MNSTPLHLLVVDDEPAHVEAVRRAFEQAGVGADIDAAATLSEYREHVGAHLPDMALVDLNLPDGRATEVLTYPPEDAPFPVLVMTAFGNQESVVEVMKAGAIDYVVKSPEAFTSMPQTVERVFREWHLLQTRKQNRAALSHLGAIVEFSGDAIISKDLNSIITSWNKGAEKLFGYSSAEIIGTSILRLIPAGRQDEENQIFQKVARGENVEHFDTVRQSKSGQLIDVSITVSPIRDACGKIIGLSKSARDITARKKAEEALSQYARKIASHNDELKRFNRIAVDRELRMIELKHEVNVLCAKLGEPPRHRIPVSEAVPQATAETQK